MRSVEAIDIRRKHLHRKDRKFGMGELRLVLRREAYVLNVGYGYNIDCYVVFIMHAIHQENSLVCRFIILYNCCMRSVEAIDIRRKNLHRKE